MRESRKRMQIARRIIQREKFIPNEEEILRRAREGSLKREVRAERMRMATATLPRAERSWFQSWRLW